MAEIANKSLYVQLREKAERCRQNAIRAESEGARKLWFEIAQKLEIKAGNLPLLKAEVVV